tara:strand:+ start:6353 stop:6871 length:519 start_codon:yes stop_codon:yes gene_type:complete
MELEILVFQCEQRHFGVETHFVREVLRAVSLTPVPKAPDGVMGLVNLRGHVMPVLDTKQLLGLGNAKIRTTDHLIVMRVGCCEIAWHVDHAVDLIRVRSDDNTGGNTADSETTAEGDHARSETSPSPRFLRTVAKTQLGVVQVLDPTRLYSENAMKDVLELAASVVATEYTS